MPFNGSGTFIPLASPTYPAVAGQIIYAARFNSNLTDIHSGLTNCLTRDGQSALTANLNAGGFKLTNLAAATADTEAIRRGEAVLRAGLLANLPAGGFKLTGLAAGTANGDSVRFDELNALSARVTALEAEDTARIGMIYAWPVDGFYPSDSLVCEGQAVSRTTYATLFARIGTTYGAGNGSTTFNVPDFRAMTLRGWDHGRGVDAARAIASYQADALAIHDHTFTTTTNSGHAHMAFRDTYSAPVNPSVTQITASNYAATYSSTGGEASAQLGGSASTANVGLVSLESAHTHGGTTDWNSGGVLETRVKNMAIVYMIKAL